MEDLDKAAPRVEELAAARAERLKRSQVRLRAAGTSKRERQAADGATAAAKRAATPRTADRRTLIGGRLRAELEAQLPHARGEAAHIIHVPTLNGRR